MRRPVPHALALALALLSASCATQPPARPPSPGPAPANPATLPERPSRVAPSAVPLALDRESDIEVGLAWDLESLELQLEAGAFLVTAGGRGQQIPRSAGPLRFALRDGAIEVRPAGKEPLLTFPPGDTLWIGQDYNHSTARDWSVRWNGRTWRGVLKIFLNPRGKITLADRLPLETYLLGVVPGEIGGLTPDLLEAGRAQAVAARSYTLFYRGRRAAEGFDLYGTVEDQVYGAIESERPLATKCVESTRGQFALWAGQPIRANYCSTCGGISAEVWEAWPAQTLPYLRSVRDRGGREDFCAGSSQYRWRERWTADELLANVAAWAPRMGITLPPGGLGSLTDVRAEARSRSGRVWRLTVQTTTQRISLPAYAVRQVLRRGGNPGAILRSNLFKIGVVRDRSGRVTEVVASGAGAGHGVGLCQTGALGMARAGRQAEEILRHYYPGADLKRLY